jgi:hypothetical protein
LQKPSFPQLAAPASVHWFCGSCPAGTLVQVPTVPASAHDWQVPPHAVWQQTPCAQNPKAHSLFDAQVAPTAFFTQLPPLQMNGEMQSVSTVHVVLHAVAPHT